jgi:hypothetical protein
MSSGFDSTESSTGRGARTPQTHRSKKKKKKEEEGRRRKKTEEDGRRPKTGHSCAQKGHGA